MSSLRWRDARDVPIALVCCSWTATGSGSVVPRARRPRDAARRAFCALAVEGGPLVVPDADRLASREPVVRAPKVCFTPVPRSMTGRGARTACVIDRRRGSSTRAARRAARARTQVLAQLRVRMLLAQSSARPALLLLEGRARPGPRSSDATLQASPRSRSGVRRRVLGNDLQPDGALRRVGESGLTVRASRGARPREQDEEKGRDARGAGGGPRSPVPRLPRLAGDADRDGPPTRVVERIDITSAMCARYGRGVAAVAQRRFMHARS